MLHAMDIGWDAFVILYNLGLGILKIVTEYHETSLGDLSWFLLANFVLCYLEVTNATSSW